MSSFVVEETVGLARHSAKQVRYLPTQFSGNHGNLTD